jgi:hypothetical protein
MSLVEKPPAIAETDAPMAARTLPRGSYDIERPRHVRGRYLRSALPWIGLLLVFALSNLTVDRAGGAPLQRNWVFGRLDSTHSYGQTFVVERDELVAVQVLLFAGPTTRDDPVTLRLRYASSDLPDLAVVTHPLSALARQEMTVFAFAPLTFVFPPGVVTTTLRIDLEAPTLTPPDWVTVMAGPNTYSAGELFVDGMPKSGADLAFQPIYRQRWFDLVLPISRMAYGRPGLMGWPPFYAVLAYGYVVALWQALTRVWRAIDAR